MGRDPLSGQRAVLRRPNPIAGLADALSGAGARRAGTAYQCGMRTWHRDATARSSLPRNRRSRSRPGDAGGRGAPRGRAGSGTSSGAGRGEDLPAGLGSFRVATFAQSFHWMDRDRVAEIVFDMLEQGGALVHISDVKGDEARETSADELPHPFPPFAAIRKLIRRYLGPVPRAGQGFPNMATRMVKRSSCATPSSAARAGADTGRRRRAWRDDLVAWVYSLSGSAPHLFGDRLDEFESDLRSTA